MRISDAQPVATGIASAVVRVVPLVADYLFVPLIYWIVVVPPSEVELNECPAPTQNIELNLENRQKAINEYGYGPLNPNEPNEKFWQAKVNMVS